MGKRIFGSLDPFFESGPVLGRRMANSKFLTALIRSRAFDELHFFAYSRGAAAELSESLGRMYPEDAAEGRLRTFTRVKLPEALSGTDYHVFHLSDCMNHPFHVARLRNAYSRAIFPVTGTTHSLSYADHPVCLHKHFFPGLTPRDRIVATSKAGQAVVEAYFVHLRRAYGLDPKRFPEPGTAVIPLGVETGDFRPASPAEREAARASLGIGPDTCAMLVFGRIDHSSKMDLLPLFRAVSRAFASGLAKDRLCLVVSGWIEDEERGYLETLSQLAANLGLRLIAELRPTEAKKRAVYAASDVFCSPVDNPQETFGITLLEAQSAGLPVIASDFDGYRELVEPEKTGLLVPVTGPARTSEVDMLAPISCDNHYHLWLAQRFAVDVPALAGAIVRLASDSDLRAAMGAAGRENAAKYSWDVCVERHLELWDELWRADPGDRQELAKAAHPLHPPYATIFAGHPGRLLDPKDTLRQTRAGAAVQRGQDFPVIYEAMEDRITPGRLKALMVYARIPASVEALCAKLAAAEPGLSVELAEATVLFALKHDLLEYGGG